MSQLLVQNGKSNKSAAFVLLYVCFLTRGLLINHIFFLNKEKMAIKICIVETLHAEATEECLGFECGKSPPRLGHLNSTPCRGDCFGRLMNMGPSWQTEPPG